MNRLTLAIKWDMQRDCKPHWTPKEKGANNWELGEDFLMARIECPECSYAVNGDSVRAMQKVEDHMDAEHPSSHKQPVEFEDDDEE